MRKLRLLWPLFSFNETRAAHVLRKKKKLRLPVRRGGPTPGHGMEGHPKRGPWQSSPGPWRGANGRCPGEVSPARPPVERRHGWAKFLDVSGSRLSFGNDGLGSLILCTCVEWRYSVTAWWAQLTVNNTFPLIIVWLRQNWLKARTSHLFPSFFCNTWCISFFFISVKNRL
jgi:hypothetical protein